MERPAIRTDFDAADSDRQETLNRARVCSALTKPWILPPEGWTENSKLPETFSSLASRGCTNLEGRLLLALFPPGMPFFKLQPAAKLAFDPTVEPDVLEEFKNHLALHELIVQSKLDSSDKARSSNARTAGFRSRMRTAISQLIITGDVLLQLLPDYSIRVFRRDNYVTKRDDSGNVLFHIIKEKIDPLILTPEQLAMVNKNQEQLNSSDVSKRMEDLYTKVSWNPLTNLWVIEQEILGKVIVTSEEEVSPFFSVPFELPPASDYGRGLIEANLGDVRSLNELTERILDFSALASKHIFAVDYNSQVRAQDLAQPTGSVIQARVQSGQVTDVGMLRTDKLSDFNVVMNTRENIRRDLATVMLMEGETTPRGDRVTAYQVQRVAQELEGALGGVYAPIADAMQVPLIERLMHQLKKDQLLPTLPDDTVQVEAITGIMALSRESDQGKLLNLIQTMAQLGPETMSRVNMGQLIDLLMRQSGIYEPGLVKSEEEIQQEQQAAQQAAQQQQMQQQMMQSMGQRYVKEGPEELSQEQEMQQ